MTITPSTCTLLCNNEELLQRRQPSSAFKDASSVTEATMDCSSTEQSWRSCNNDSCFGDCDVSGMAVVRRDEQRKKHGDVEEIKQPTPVSKRQTRVAFSEVVTFRDSSPKWGPFVEKSDERKTEEAKTEVKEAEAKEEFDDNDDDRNDSEGCEEVVKPEDIWWTKEELKKVEQDAGLMVKEMRDFREEVFAAVLFNKGFHMAHYLAKNIAEEDLERSMQNHASEVRTHAHSLSQWTAVGNAKRGLEGLVCKESALKAVAICKAILEQASQNGSVDALARHSMDLTRGSRIMARLLGHADRESLEQALALEQANLKSSQQRQQERGGNTKPDFQSTEFVMEFDEGPQEHKRSVQSIKAWFKKVKKVFRRKTSSKNQPKSELGAREALELLELAEQSQVKRAPRLPQQMSLRTLGSHFPHVSLRTLGKLEYE